MTPEEWVARAVRDLGEEPPPDDAEDAALAYADRLLANEEALGRVERINASAYGSVTLHDDDGNARVIERGDRGMWLSGDGRLWLFSNE